MSEYRGSAGSYAYDQATQDLSLSPQEQYLYLHHLDNLYGGKGVSHPSGETSTILQTIVTGPDGRYYNIPTVWDGQVLDPRSAAQRASQAGWDKWPAYATPRMAEMRYQRMHPYFERDFLEHPELLQNQQPLR